MNSTITRMRLEIKNEVPKTNLLIKGSKVKCDETKAENRIRKNRMMNTTHFDNIRLGIRDCKSNLIKYQFENVYKNNYGSKELSFDERVYKQSFAKFSLSKYKEVGTQKINYSNTEDFINEFEKSNISACTSKENMPIMTPNFIDLKQIRENNAKSANRSNLKTPAKRLTENSKLNATVDINERKTVKQNFVVNDKSILHEVIEGEAYPSPLRHLSNESRHSSEKKTAKKQIHNIISKNDKRDIFSSSIETNKDLQSDQIMEVKQNDSKENISVGNDNTYYSNQLYNEIFTLINQWDIIRKVYARKVGKKVSQDTTLVVLQVIKKEQEVIQSHTKRKQLMSYLKLKICIILILRQINQINLEKILIVPTSRRVQRDKSAPTCNRKINKSRILRSNELKSKNITRYFHPHKQRDCVNGKTLFRELLNSKKDQTYEYAKRTKSKLFKVPLLKNVVRYDLFNLNNAKKV